MKKIKIAHLYYDAMNLYGEEGNVRALEKFISRQGITCEVHKLSIGDDIDFNAYDFYYIGCGSEDNQMLVLEDLKKYKDDIESALKKGKMILATGNAMELFGRKIKFKDAHSIDCLGLFDYQAVELDRRNVSEIFYKYDQLEEGKGRDILGFRNSNCNIIHNNNRMFEFPNSVNIGSFYGIDFVGPLLIRNPYFTNMLIEKLFKEKDIPYKTITDTIEFKAYREFLNNFIINSDID